MATCSEKDCKNEPHDEKGLCAYHRIIGGNGKVKEEVLNNVKTFPFTITLDYLSDWVNINANLDDDAWEKINNTMITITGQVDENGNVSALAAR